MANEGNTMNDPVAELHTDIEEKSYTPKASNTEISPLLAAYRKQKEAYLDAPEPSYDQRMQDLRTLKKMLMKHSREIKEAINADYGNRSGIETSLADIGSSGAFINDINNYRRHRTPQNFGS